MADYLNRDATATTRKRRSRNRSFTTDVALVSPSLPNLRVGTLALETWTSNPNLRVFDLALESWTIQGTTNLRVGELALESWVVNAGNLRVAALALETWSPGAVAALTLSMRPPSPPELTVHSGRVNRSFSPQVAPPQLALNATSRALFPPLQGLQYPVVKELLYGAVTQAVASGKRFTVAEWCDPVWLYTLSYEFLRQDAVAAEAQMLMGLFLQSLGQDKTFLYDDTDDDVATNVIIGDAVGGPPVVTQVIYQLLRNFYDSSGNVLANAPVYAIKSITSVRVGAAADGSGGTVVTDYVLGTNGCIVFNTSPWISAPPGSHNYIAWTGEFYQVCRFEDDYQDFDQLWYQMFELKQLKFKTEKPVLA